MQIPIRQSAYAARKNGEYKRIVDAMRECETVRGLMTIWAFKQPVITQMPEHWAEELRNEYDAIWERMGGR
jgi:hypothetical protein